MDLIPVLKYKTKQIIPCFTTLQNWLSPWQYFIRAWRHNCCLKNRVWQFWWEACASGFNYTLIAIPLQTRHKRSPRKSIFSQWFNHTGLVECLLPMIAQLLGESACRAWHIASVCKFKQFSGGNKIFKMITFTVKRSLFFLSCLILQSKI